MIDREFTGQDRSTAAGRAALQARLAAIVDSSDDGIISKDLNGVVQSWNPAAERIFGYTAEEILHQSILTIIPSDRQHEEREILDRLRRGERIDHFQTVRQRKDGRLIPVSVTISPIHDADNNVVAASKVVRDLSATSELESYFTAIVESSDDAIVSKSLDGIVRSWNPGAERIFGYTAAEMVGQPIETIFPPERKDEEPRILERLRSGERVDHFETVRVRKDGTPVDISVTISPVRSPTGEIIRALKIARDITAYKQLLKDREKLLESEQHARREAERQSRVKDEFLATLSHELRTPMNAILGWSQVLRQRAEEVTCGGAAADANVWGEMVEGLEVIERNTRVQTQLIEDLLDMSRITAGKLRLDVQRVDLGDVVKAALASVRHAAEAKGVRLQIVLDPLAGPVRGDPARLQQCTWNLLSNAIKFTPKGGKVQVSLERVNSHLEVCVNDNGEGIDPELLPHLFERFRQGDASTTRRHGGMGLGLSIVRHLIELHGGTVRAKSAGPGQGSTFCIELPLMVVQAATDSADRTHPRGQASPAFVDFPSLEGITVLAVDDQPDALGLIKRLLEGCGARVVLAGSAREALERVLSDRPDMIVSDIGMPDEDGYDFIRAVRALTPAEGGRTPAAALSAFARAEDRTRALLAGFQTHVAKPVEPTELIAVVASLTLNR